jgi:lipoprotein-releasing system permease protein
VEGRLPDTGNQDTLEILISGSLAKLLHLKTGMKLPAYFVQEPPRMRSFVISGIYRTGLEEYDRLFAWCSIDQVREINNWTPGLVSGYEVLLADPAKMESTASAIREITDDEGINKSNLLQVRTIREIAPGFFDFLSLTDTNVWVILTLMILIAGFNMISGLLIIILDRTRMIGVLKALGTDNRSMVRIFLYQAAFITGKGLIIGNLIGLVLAVIQDRFRIIPLDPASYFVDSVPVLINPLHLILLNAGTLVLTILMLLLPSGVIARISPDKTIKFD